MNVGPEQILGEQLAYYRARAGEYDRWFLREGRYDRGSAARQRWFAELEQVRAALRRVPLDGGDVVELAAGTGIWTEVLAGRAAHVTAVDASPEMIEENRRRLGGLSQRVSYVLADLFAWNPGENLECGGLLFLDQPRPRLTPRQLSAKGRWHAPPGRGCVLRGRPSRADLHGR